MSYTKKTWQTGDTIQAANLNNIENGVSGHDYMTQYLKTDTNGAYLYDSTSGSKVYLRDLASSQPSGSGSGSNSSCFRGDTTYVTMANGSKKLVSDLVVGDQVLGYDVNTKDYCTTTVLSNPMTGKENRFTCCVMDDGTTIDIYNSDTFITHHKSTNYGDADGDFINVVSMNDLKWFVNNSQGFRKVIKDTGNLTNTTGLVMWFDTSCADLTPRYSPKTANGTLFVNGLLHGSFPEDTVAYFRRRNIDTPEVITNLWNTISAMTSTVDESLPNDHVSNPAKIGDVDTLNQAKRLIAEKKRFLSSTDYKAMKYAEGALTESDWLPIKQARIEARNAINEQEAIVEEYKAKVSANNPELIPDPYGWVTTNSKWKAIQHMLDSHAEDFHNWAQTLKNA